MIKISGLAGDDLVQAPIGEVTVGRVGIWLGIGVRLEIEGLGRWYVHPLYVRFSPNLLAGRAANRRLRSAIKAAQDARSWARHEPPRRDRTLT